MSREHIFPKWMHPHLPKTGRLNHVHKREFIRLTGPDVEVRPRSGEPFAGQLRIVCEACNNGWMSKLQEATKPILLPLIEGKSTHLNRVAIARLSAWIAMFVMVAEFAGNDPLFVSATDDDRRWLMEHGEPPHGWKIWIGHYVRGTWPGTMMHTAVPVAPTGATAEDYEGRALKPNVSSTTFVANELFVTVFTSKIDAVLSKQYLPRKSLPRLWPIARGAMAWPPPATVPDLHADQIASALSERSRMAKPAFED